jgi:DUF1680 family protein
MRSVPRRIASLALVSLVLGRMLAAAEAPAALPPPPAFAASSPGRVAFCDLADVRLLEGPFQQAQERDRAYLLAMDPDRLLLMFRVTAGLASNAKPLGGWEAPGVELRGHTLGHYLSACSLMFAATGDEQLRKKIDHIVADLARCQGAMPKQGFHEGYLSAFPESFFDRVDAHQPVWAPWYTMHKIMAGLFDAHVHGGNTQALEVLEKLAGWVRFRVDRLTPAQMQASLQNEHGGMTEVLANLAGVTQNPEYLRLSAAFNHRAVLDPLSQRVDALNGLHANTQIPKVTGAAREYELTGNPEYRVIANFFWETVAWHRSYALGGDSDNEHFFPVSDFAKHLTPVTAETCNTYNMLKLTMHVFAWAPAVSSMDYYERGLYNQILASQDPKTGMFEYFVAMKPGHFKTYSTPENSFWCCVGTGMEDHARYGEAIYARDDASLWVNLFIPSELKWKESGIVVRQETRFPEQSGVTLRIATPKPADFSLLVRRPGWIAGDMTATVNGQAAPLATDASGYGRIQREWHDGDVVVLTLPMALRTEPLPGSRNTIAFFYGPLLLAGELGTDGMPREGAYANDQKDFAKWPTPPVPTLVGDIPAIVAATKLADAGALRFRTEGVGRPKDLSLIPFYRLHHERYSVYWDVEAPTPSSP